MLKLFLVIGISLFLFSCADNAKNSKQKITKETYQGKIDSYSNIIIKLILKDNLIYGELNYPNKKDTSSFTLIGEIKSDSTYRIQAFSDSGYVFSIIGFNYLRKTINGTWFSPSELEEQNIELAKLDSEPNNLQMLTNNSDKTGTYFYTYGEANYNGQIELVKLKENTYTFSLIALGRGAAPAIVEIETDTIEITNHEFRYRIKNTDSCSIRVEVYKEFIYVVSEDNSDCFLQYGMNTYPDGFFLKMKTKKD